MSAGTTTLPSTVRAALPGNVSYHPRRDVTESAADLLTCTVNEVGVMGAGVALAFRKRWPGIVASYAAACCDGRLRAGGCLLLPLPDGRLWAALATKADWRNPSRIEWVESGLACLSNPAVPGRLGTLVPPQDCTETPARRQRARRPADAQGRTARNRNRSG